MTRLSSTSLSQSNKYAFKSIHYMNLKAPNYQREYIKLPDIAANVGGILSFFIPFIEYFLRVFIDNEYALFLYYSFFRMKEYELNNKDKQNDIQHIQIDYSNNMIENSAAPENLKFNNDLKTLKFSDAEKSSNKMLDIQEPNLNLNISLAKPNPYKLKELHKRDTILNKEISKVIKSKNKKAIDINISFSDRFSFVNCCGESKTKTNSLYNLINIIENELVKKCDFVKILRKLDQFSLIKKIILNEGQCMLLNNRDLKIITSKDENLLTSKRIEIDGDEGINEHIRVSIINYLKSRMETNSISEIDKLLVKYLPAEYQLNELNFFKGKSCEVRN